MVYLGADHAGFSLKEKIKTFLDVCGFEYQDLGAGSFDQDDDYPPFAKKVAEAVVEDEGSKGVLICGTGTGMVIAANKVPGARAAFGFSDYAAKMARVDNDANILTFSGRKQSEEEVIRMIKIFLEAEFGGEERHQRRLEEIKKLEGAYGKKA